MDGREAVDEGDGEDVDGREDPVSADDGDVAAVADAGSSEAPVQVLAQVEVAPPCPADA